MSPEHPVPGQEIKAVVDVRDPDGDPLRLRYVWRHNGVEVARGSRPVVYIPDLQKGDEVELSVTASDGRRESQALSARGTVRNRPPVLTAVSLSPFGDVRAGQPISAEPHASDPDHDELEFDYRWTVNGAPAGSDRILETSRLHRGDRIQVSVVASDGEARSREVSSPILPLGNTPPVITQLPDLERSDGTFRYRFEAKDADGDHNLRFFLASGPPGMHMDPVTGELTWHPDASQAGVHPVEVGVRDPSGEGTTFLFQVTVSATPAPPASPAPERRR